MYPLVCVSVRDEDRGNIYIYIKHKYFRINHQRRHSIDRDFWSSSMSEEAAMEMAMAMTMAMTTNRKTRG